MDALDAAIGRILAALDKQGLRDNTLVVFFSDNGASGREGGSNGPFRAGKATVFEGGIHTPCLMRWPGQIKAGTASQQPLAVQDLFPTLAAAVGVTVKEGAETRWQESLGTAPQRPGARPRPLCHRRRRFRDL